MRKETLLERNEEPKVFIKKPTTSSLGSTPKIVPAESYSDKINQFDKKGGPIPRYSDEYEEFDDLERNEDTFGPDTD